MNTKLSWIKKNHAFVVLAALLLAMGSATGWANVQTFTSSTTWTCPSGVTSVQVECWGGGGSGGGAVKGTATGEGGGGGGGAYAKKNSVAVTAGNNYTVTVGAGGTSVSGDGYSGPGGDSWFNTSSTAIAKGGGGGVAVSTSGGGSGGAGGSSGSSIGDVVFAGGSGAAGSSSGGGGGGSSAGTGSVGNNGTGVTGGAAPTGGGAGGTGVNVNQTGASGGTPGGAGAGARANSATQQAGGAGAAGQVTLTYTISGVETIHTILPGETFTSGTGLGGSPTAQNAGSAFTATLYCVQSDGVTVDTTYAGSHSITISGPTAGTFSPSAPTSVTFNSGEGTISVTLSNAVSTTLSSTDGTLAGTGSTAVAVNAGLAAQLQVLMPGETNAAGAATGKGGTPTAQTAGTGYSVTVNAVDSYWNLVSSTHTVAITSSDANAILPANAALVAGTKTFSITNKTAGSQTVTATDQNGSPLTANTGSATTIGLNSAKILQVLMPGETAAPGTATGKTGTPSTETAGTPFNVTVNLVDNYFNFNSSGSHKIYINATTDPNASVPSTTNGMVSGTVSIPFTFQTATSSGWTVTVTDTNVAGSYGFGTSSATPVTGGAATQLLVLMPGETVMQGTSPGKTGTASAQTAGTPFNVTVYALDANWNINVTATTNINFTSSDGAATFPANGTTALVAGTAIVSATFGTANASPTSTITAADAASVLTADTGTGVIVNGGNMITVLPGQTFSSGSAVSGTPTTQTAGTAFTADLYAVGGDGVTVDTSYSGSKSIAITGPPAGTFSPSTSIAVAFTGGHGQISITLNKAAPATISSSDGTLTGTASSTVAVNAGAPTQLQVLMPGETAAPATGSGKIGSPAAHAAGAGYSVTVNAVDANWNLVNTATPTVGVTSSDPGAILPANAALVAGTQTFSVTNKVAGSQTFTATDTSIVSPLDSNTGSSVTINAGAATQLLVLMPGETSAPGTSTGRAGIPATQTAGTQFNVAVDAVDAYWNPVTSSHRVKIVSSTDPNSTAPTATVTMSGGTASVPFTFKTATASGWTATASDSSAGPLASNTGAATLVNAGTPTQLQVLMPGENAAPGTSTGKTGSPNAQTAGTAFSVTVKAVDANWNLTANVMHTVAITSATDGAATLPANAALVAGTQTFSMTFNTAGSQTATAADQDVSPLAVNTGSSTTVNKASTAVTVTSSENPSGYWDSVVFTAMLPSAATGSVTFLTNGVVYDMETLSGGSANSLSITNLPRGTNEITVQYAGDGNYSGSTNDLVGGQIVTNHPPVAEDVTYYRAESYPLTIYLTNLFTNVTDVDGDTISLTSVGAGTNGATITTNSTSITYIPSTGANSNDNDSFTYTVSDGYGGSATANINVAVVNATEPAQMGTPTNGVVNIKFFGLPGYNYVVETGTNVTFTPAWPLSTNTPGGDGSWMFTDPNATNAQQYYRLTQP